ncbi:RNA polymerase sigma factor [Microbacterium protaetiae]|uniref:RNA polymerase sigma factor n=1 Tax=Microbacterium protaetiae TaxID=2509458 RepID=UPI00241434A9|nr:sigma-70 family RNA polymerase sigma factor [Microbacterium protaetiae]
MYDAHFIDVLRYVRRRVADRGHAEDIAAETFMVALAKLTSTEAALPWLYATARNKVMQYYRSAARRRRAEQSLIDNSIVAANGISHIDRLAVREALAGLGNREREVILLTYWDQLSAQEVATVLGCSTASVWTALSRGRGKLRQLLGEESSLGGVGQTWMMRVSVN